MVEWGGIPDHERDERIDRLNRARRIGEDDGVYFEHEPFFEDVVGVLEAVLEPPDGIPEAEARSGVSAALFARGVANLDAWGMRRTIEEQVAEFLDADPNP